MKYIITCGNEEDPHTVYYELFNTVVDAQAKGKELRINTFNIVRIDPIRLFFVQGANYGVPSS